MPNRLADETSPYLRQHADNPVDWRPWGPDALREAAERDRPILLSVGYSSCHWCHVMAHESFEDNATAAVMNRLFVNIKVDREERPDVDAIYMEAVQAVNGSGGWPMTVFLTPDGRPFFAGTYYPREAGRGMPAFSQVLEAVSEAWDGRRLEVLAQADQLAAAVGARATIPQLEGATPPASWADPSAGRGVLDQARAQLLRLYDPEWGGFGSAPKFPQPAMVDVLLAADAHTGDAESMAAVATTLDAMASGGIYDHVGGGFARYSVDGHWLVPHFEKMLYDQAGLVRIYLHGWQHTGNPAWLQVVEETIGYVLRDLADPAGGLCSAEDADSEGHEGRFYVWSAEELAAVVGPDLSGQAAQWWGVSPAGNFEGANILHRPVRGDLLRPALVEEARRRLFEARRRRVRPGRDDKVLTEWNAMFVSSLAEAGAAAGRPEWVAAAERTAEFLLAQLRRPDGRWLRSWQGGRAHLLAYAADHAWLVDAFTRLAEATGRARWLAEAEASAAALVDLFWDSEGGGLLTTGRDAERLIVRAQEYLDGAVAAANSVGAVALIRLGALTGRDEYRARGEAILDRLGGVLASHPTALCHALGAVDLLAHGPVEVVVAGDRPDLLAEVRRRHLPAAVMAWGERTAGPLWEGRRDGAAYLCRGYACQAPASSVEVLAAQLDEV